MKTIPDLGIQIPQIYLPRTGVDLARWAVIACDQFTSEPEYWADVEKIVGAAPSTLRLTLPEVHLETPGVEDRIRSIQSTMREYLADGTVVPRDGMIYVERAANGRTRRGLMLCLDLDQYDYSAGSSSLIRATEGTIVERLPPRIKVREGALFELPHILVLIDDPERTVIEPVQNSRSSMEKLYDFELMLESGHLRGYALTPELEVRVIDALRGLARPDAFAAKYDVERDQAVILFAMGDGNHSLATAKAIWEKMKPNVPADHPARFALVEIENVHDEGLEFEPIHRVLFGLKRDLFGALNTYFGSNVKYTAAAGAEEMLRSTETVAVGKHSIGLVGGASDKRYGVLEISNPKMNLPVGEIQTFIDGFINAGGAEKVDYVHGLEVVRRLGSQPGNAGFLLPAMRKSDLFRTVILDGALPRKTFSMGAAREKRFYMEARKISE